MNDKRRDPRVNANKEIWLEGQEQMRLGRTQNLSKGGMFVVAEGATPDVGQELEIHLDDPEEGRIGLKMEVVWRKEGEGVGLRALSSAGQEAFERVVSRHMETDGKGPSERPAPEIARKVANSGAVLPEVPAPTIEERDDGTGTDS